MPAIIGTTMRCITSDPVPVLHDRISHDQAHGPIRFRPLIEPRAIVSYEVGPGANTDLFGSTFEDGADDAGLDGINLTILY